MHLHIQNVVDTISQPCIYSKSNEQQLSRLLSKDKKVDNAKHSDRDVRACIMFANEVGEQNNVYLNKVSPTELVKVSEATEIYTQPLFPKIYAKFVFVLLV